MSAVTPLRTPTLDDVIRDMVAAAIEDAVTRHNDLRLLDDDEVAARLAVSTRTVGRLIESGRLPSVVVGARSRRVRSDVLNDYIRALSGGAQ